MKLQKILGLTVIAMSLIFFSCAGDPEQIFGFEIVDDVDHPYIEILSVVLEKPNHTKYEINYAVADVSGIAKLELFVNNNYEITFSATSSNCVTWDKGDSLEDVDLQIKAFDNLGKVSLSNIYTLVVPVLNFEVIDNPDAENSFVEFDIPDVPDREISDFTKHQKNCYLSD